MGKPNVLVLMCDQFRFDCIAALGNKDVLTPNLDRLVRRGAAFTNAYSTCPVCVPARYTLRTGREPHTTGCYMNEIPEAMDGLDPEMTKRCGPYLAQRMREMGYRTFAGGKFHTFPDIREDIGYDSRVFTDEMWATQSDRESDDYAAYIARKYPDMAHIQQLHGERTNMYYVPQMGVFPPEDMVEGFISHAIVRELEKDDKRPYFGFVSFPGPHPPCAPPVPYNLIYNPDDMPHPLLGDAETDHMDEQITWMNRAIWADELSDFDARNFRTRYYGEITFIDHCIGEILDAVEKRPDADNTAILFVSDHGEALGDHHAWQKESYFEQSTHIPFLMSWPGHVDAGARSDMLVCLTDVFGIATALAGDEEVRDGAPVWSAYQAGREARDCLVATYGRPGTPLFKMMARKGDWKYILMANGGREQLFNLKDDPNELTLVRDQSVQDEMRGICERFCDQPGLYQALENGKVRAYPFAPRPLMRIRQFDVSRGIRDFTGGKKHGV